MLRYRMIRLLTALTIILLSQTLVGAAERKINKIADTIQIFCAESQTDDSTNES